MIDSFQNAFFAFYVLYLLKTNDLALFQTFQGQRIRLRWVVTMLYQADPTEGTRAQGGNKVEIVQIKVALFFSLSAALSLLWGVLGSIVLGVVQDVLWLLLILVWFLFTSTNFL